MMRWLLTLLGLSLSTATANPLLDDNQLGLLVPAYFYPGQSDRHWPALALAATKVPMTVIMNPANGPGSTTDPAYAQAARQTRAAGAKLIGYVHISYGKRPLEQVTADIDQYRALYEVDGIFIDEMAGDASPASVSYQKRLIKQIRNESPDWIIVGNPGVMPHPVHLREGGADLVVSFENTAAQWAVTHAPLDGPNPAPVIRETAGLAHLVHTTGDEKTMHVIVSGAADRGIHALYVTDDIMDNPWDTLPGWWTSLIDHIEAINNGA